MNYTLNQLQIFLKVTQTKSVTKAAEELHLTQPAVSIQLKNFQDQFDIPLTEIIGRNIYITEFGLEIADAARNILNQVQAIDFKTLAYKGQLSGKLKISVVSTGKYVLPFFLTLFLRKHVGVELLMDVTNKNLVLQSLEKNEVDFALVSILPTNLSIDKLELLENKLFLVGNSETHSCKTQVKDIFKNHPLIFREKGSGTRVVMEEYISKKKFTIHKKLELTTNEAVKQALMADLGISIVPLIGIRNEIMNHELNIIPMKGLPIKTTWHLIWLKGKKLSPIANAFLKFLGEEKENIIREKFEWCNDF